MCGADLRREENGYGRKRAAGVYGRRLHCGAVGFFAFPLGGISLLSAGQQPRGYLELLRLQDRFVYLPELPYREVDLDQAARNILTQEQFAQDGGEGTVASWRNTATIRNVHPNTTVAFRMNNLSGSASDLTLYAYGADGKLVKVAPELWSITDESGAAVTELTDGVLYELRVTVADGGDFDLSETEKEIKLSVVLGK